MADGAQWIAAESGLAALFRALEERDYTVYGPVEQDGTIGLEPVGSPDSLPRGRIMDSTPGRVSCRAGSADRLFDKSLSMQALKPLVFPPREELYRMDASLNVTIAPADTQKIAVIGARACDLAALKVLDIVLCGGPYPDEPYRYRREDLLLIAVDCAVPLETCFCSSMQTGPHARDGFDLALTELTDDRDHGLLIRIGSAAGARILEAMNTRCADESHLQAKQSQAECATLAMTRQMPANAGKVVKSSHDNVHWQAVAERCLLCANCTMVCPTCFCSTIEDRSALDGTTWRERRWDSCYSLQFSHIHGGAVRASSEARYRQWITHKLGYWHDQFGVSGCVGCGRCIAWCPVGIDITQEVAALERNLPDAAPLDGADRAQGVS